MLTMCSSSFGEGVVMSSAIYFDTSAKLAKFVKFLIARCNRADEHTSTCHHRSDARRGEGRTRALSLSCRAAACVTRREPERGWSGWQALGGI